MPAAPLQPGDAARRRPRHAHAAADADAAQAAGRGRRAQRCSTMCSTGSRRPASRRWSSTSITSPTRWRRISPAGGGRASSSRTSAQRLLDSGGGVKKALPLLGAAPFIVCNCRQLLDRGTAPQSRRADRRLGSVGAWTSSCCSPRRRRASAIDGTRRLPLDAAGSPRAAAREREVVPFAYAGVLLIKPELFAGMPGQSSRSTASSTPPRREAASSAGASTASGCMSARPRRSARRRSGSPARRPCRFAVRRRRRRIAFSTPDLYARYRLIRGSVAYAKRLCMKPRYLRSTNATHARSRCHPRLRRRALRRRRLARPRHRRHRRARPRARCGRRRRLHRRRRDRRRRLAELSPSPASPSWRRASTASSSPSSSPARPISSTSPGSCGRRRRLLPDRGSPRPAARAG